MRGTLVCDNSLSLSLSLFSPLGRGANLVDKKRLVTPEKPETFHLLHLSGMKKLAKTKGREAGDRMIKVVEIR